MSQRTPRAIARGILPLLALLGVAAVPGESSFLRVALVVGAVLTLVSVLTWRESRRRRSDRQAELESLRLSLRRARARAARDDLLAELQEELRGRIDEERVWGTACSVLVRALDASRVLVYQKDRKGGYLLRRWFPKEDGDSLEQGAGLPTASGPVVPVECGGAERAALVVERGDGSRTFSDEDNRFVQRFARALALALDGIDRTRRLEHESETRSGLLQLAQALAATPETGSIVEIALSAGAPLAGAVRGAVLLKDASGEFRVAAGSALAEALGSVSLSTSWSRIDEALSARTAVLLDGSETNAGRRSSSSATGRFAFVPMYYGRDPVGVLLLESDPAGGEGLDLEVARRVAELVAAALENARRFESLAASEASYAALFEEGAEIALVLDDTGMVRASNPAARRILGYSQRELAGLPLASLLGSESAGLWRKVEKSLFGEGKVHDARLALRRKDGGALEVVATAAVVGAPSGAARKTARILMRDVSELRSVEQQLRHSQKLEVVGALAGGIAHDFNNVLGGILGYASLLRAYLKDRPIAAKYLETIERSAIRGAELTGRLLAASRKTPSRWEPVNLNLVVEETLELLAHSLHKSIRIDKRLDPRVRAMMADASQLQQIVLNLCVNARDAMPKGGLLRVSTRLDEDGDKLRLTVEDTGVGMDAKTLARLFEPFFSTKGEAGTGLGLSVVYGIVRALGGEIGVNSSPGRGARFDVVVPCHLVEDALPPDEDVDEPARGHGELILLVDDEKVLRELGRDILESHGYRVTTVASGEEALEFVRSAGETVALVILDVVMPGLGGSGTYQRLRRLGSSIPVLLSSGLAAEEVVQDLLHEGATGFIPKPYGIVDLTRAVSSALERPNPTLVH